MRLPRVILPFAFAFAWLILTPLFAADHETDVLEDQPPKPDAPRIEAQAEAPEAPADVVPAPPAEDEIQVPEAPPEPKVERPRRRTRGRAPAARRAGSERVEIGRDVVIEAGEVVRELIVIAGNARVDGRVDGSLIVVSGQAEVNGEVRDDLVTVLGAARFGPEGHVGGDAVVIGGPLELEGQASIGGQQTVVSISEILPDFTWLQNWLAKGLLLARPFPPQVKWVWVVAGVFLLFYLALAVMFPRPVRACVLALEQQPAISFLVGILFVVLVGPLLFLLVVSVAGILVIPFLLCGLIAAALFGRMAVYSYAGQQLGRSFSASDLGLPLMLLIGALIFYLIYMVPVLGFAVWGIVTLLGLGAVLLAAFGSYRGDPAPAYVAVPATAGVLAPATGAAAAGSTTVGSTGLVAPPVVGPGDVLLLPRVGFWRRFFATALDVILLGILLRYTEVWFLALWTTYHVAMWTWKGTTIGGIVMGIKVVRLDGQPVDFGVALVRSLSSFFSAFALFLGFFWAGWDRERQAWHDKIAGTVVVRMPKGMSLV